MSSEEVQRVLKSASRSGVTPEEVKATYAKWESTYEQDLSTLDYETPRYIGEAARKVLKDRTDAQILDVACGTGLVAQLLHELGYINLDGVDASAEMLKVAGDKHVYRRLICDYVGTNRLDIDDDTYDLLVSCGSFVPGHLTQECFPELIRITNPGGYIVIIMTATNLKKPEFKDKFEPAMQRHHDDGQWRWESTYTVKNLYDTNDGTGYVFRDMVLLDYGPPRLAVNAVRTVLGERYDARILDVASGTGLTGQLLHELGYKNVDGVDASAEMLKAAEDKQVYGRLICDYLGTNRLDIEDDTYDLLVSCGSFVPGHLTQDCFPELIRITKPGGYIVLIIAVYHLVKPEFNKLEPTMQRLHDDGQWRWESTYPTDNLLADIASRGYHFKVTKACAKTNAN